MRKSHWLVIPLSVAVSGCGMLFGQGPASGSPSTPPERPVSTTPATNPPASTPATTREAPPSAPPTGSPTPATAAPALASPVAVARPSESASAIGTRRAALLPDGALGADEVGYYMDVQEARLRQLAAVGYTVVRRDSALVITIPGRLTFDVSSARLLPSGLESLTTLAKVLVEYRMSLITLNGYTDSSGDPQSNLALSQQRAISLARQFIADGVAAKRMVAVGHGAADPIADNANPEGRERNRRIEVRIYPVRQ